MKTSFILGIVVVLAQEEAGLGADDPRVDSWFTLNSGRYARLYSTSAQQNSGTTVTTWSRGSLSQSQPAYSGVQEIYSSSNWVYIRTTGLGSHVMGPWYLNAAKTTLFPNLPINTKVLYRVPRSPTLPGAKTLTGLGAIGYFVDGVAMFDGRDGFYWNGTSEVGGMGSGLWNRDAFINEGVTFDPANAHQPGSGKYHYHANPLALRHSLGDHVAYDSATKTYYESITNLHHSPILGWVRDGHPIYGPYGYSNPASTNSGLRRMISGFVLRNGLNNTSNLTLTGRTTLPAWAGRAYNRSTTLAAGEYGPGVNSTYPLGRYLEDNDYLGDLDAMQGGEFDLDEYGGRFCVTPEFPGGTYAYFVSVSSTGIPAFPYNIGRSFYGSPTGSTVTSLTEQVITNFAGGPDSELRLHAPIVNPGNTTITLVWSSVEGGVYRVEAKSNLASNWNNQATNVISQGITTQLTTNLSGQLDFFRVGRTGLSSYDSVK